MINNQNYPWYPQRNPVFTTLYSGFFEAAESMTPLPIGGFFDIDSVPYEMLLKLGPVWGLSGSPVYYDGMIYDIDAWGDPDTMEGKAWTGQVQTANQAIYRNFIRMKAFINARQYNYQLVKDAIDILLSGYQHTISITEGYMTFTINISASGDILRILQEMQTYDPYFLGDLPGISYDFAYTATDDSEVTND